MRTEIIVIAHNLRSIHNVGSIFRTCEGFGVRKLYLTGYTPFPAVTNDARPPHVRRKLTEALQKTALGAEQMVPFEHSDKIEPVLQACRSAGYKVVALEQSPQAILLSEYHAPQKTALVLGEEVHGIASHILAEVDSIIEIPMFGKKESFNVSVAAGIALYGLCTSKLQ